VTGNELRGLLPVWFGMRKFYGFFYPIPAAPVLVLLRACFVWHSRDHFEESNYKFKQMRLLTAAYRMA
jgi:hypothetical protein